MRNGPDHEWVRADRECPLCGAQKTHGLLACWPCFSERVQSEDDEALHLIDVRERELEEANSQFGVGA